MGAARSAVRLDLLVIAAGALLGGAGLCLALPENFQEEVVFQNLVDPTAVRFSSDGRVFVAEKSGIIKVFDGLADTTPTIVADLGPNVHNYWDRGLLSMALHPGFPATPYIYVLYTYDFDPRDPAHPAPRYGDRCEDRDENDAIIGPGPTADGCVVDGRISRLSVDPNNMLVGSEQVLLQNRWCQQYPSHSVGTLFFGPEGALYASAGDGAHFDYEDWGQFGGTRPGIDLATPANPCGDPDAPRGTPASKPDAEGGALRAQGVRTPFDNVSLDGAIVRIDPSTGAAWPGNPLVGGPNAQDDPIIAHGFRSPFRMTPRPGTSEVWIGEVGWYDWDEIDRIVSPNDSVVENFGWPCFEGPDRLPGYNPAPPDNLEICTSLSAAEVTPAYYLIAHHQPLYSGDPCDFNVGTSISGLAFYQGGSYPAAYDGALFFSDFTRGCIYVMTATQGSGDPDIASRTVFLSAADDARQIGDPDPVDLQVGPGGDLFLVDHVDGNVRRIRYSSGNGPPMASIQASPISGPVPLTVSFDGSGSTDPDPGTVLSFAWDLDGDLQYDDGFQAQVSHQYVSAGEVTVRLRVTDDGGASSTASIIIVAGNTAPNATIIAPRNAVTWHVGEAILFSGRGMDANDGTLLPSAMSWQVILHHCSSGPGTCHGHSIGTLDGVKDGHFTAPDHQYYSELEFVLTVTDSGGLTDSDSVTLAPEAVINTFGSTPAGAALSFSGYQGAAPFSHGSIIGSVNSLVAASPQAMGGTNYYFVSWNDGGGASRSFVQGGTASTYHANFAPCQASESVCDGVDNDCDGAIDDVPAPAGSPSSIAINGSSISWAPLAGAQTYDVVRGLLAPLRVSGFAGATQQCLGSDIAGLSLPYAGTPPLGQGYWFLVRGSSCAAHGTWNSGAASQVGSRDAGINGSPAGCP